MPVLVTEMTPLLVIPPENLETLVELEDAVPTLIPFLPVIVPLLVTPPEKAKTFWIAMALLLTEINPVFVTPPEKVEAPST
jgi:hypothetical protein